MPGTYRNNNGTIENLSGGTIVDEALSSTSENPVQNKVVKAAVDAINTNLDKFDKKSSAVTPTSSGKDSLLRYILDVVDPMNLSTYSFPARTFTDLPNTTSTFVVTVSRDANAFNVVAYEALSASKYYVRAMGAGGSSRTWVQSSWDRLALESESFKSIVQTKNVTANTNAYGDVMLVLDSNYLVLSTTVLSDGGGCYAIPRQVESGQWWACVYRQNAVAKSTSVTVKVYYISLT